MTTTPRLFIEPEILKTAQQEYRLTGQEAIHAIRVLRMRPGDDVILIDGEGHMAYTKIVQVNRDSLLLRLIDHDNTTSLYPYLLLEDDRLPIHLMVAILKSEKMDMVIQKATELGVKEIWPIITDHSMSKTNFRSGNRNTKSMRWKEIARQALKQCRGAFLPEIHEPMTIGDACKTIQNSVHTRLFCWEKAASINNSPWPIIIPPCALAIGPEGGFSKSEYHLLQEYRFVPVSLGSRILRAETAVISATSIAAYFIARSDKTYA